MPPHTPSNTPLNTPNPPRRDTSQPALMKYAVVVDAGSSGSRAYVYQWSDPSEVAEQASHLLSVESHPDWVTKINPGISSFVGRSKKDIYQEHLRPLVQGAQLAVPRSQRASTPIYFLATAGLRLLDEKDSSQILAHVCESLKEGPFYVGDCQRHVSMIDGQVEGLYGWLGLNYLVHTRDGSLWTEDEFASTYGFMDMGGASTQIAFVPEKAEAERHWDDLYTVSLRTNKGEALSWKLFVSTWLGFGANQAQARWHQYLADAATPEELAAIGHDSPLVLSDPCLQFGAFNHAATAQSSDTIFYGQGDFTKCEAMLEQLLNKDKPCIDEPCLFDGVHVPHFDTSVQKFVGISEYWYSAQDIFGLSGKFDYETFLTSATDFCKQDWSEVESNLEKGVYGDQLDKEHILQGCFKSAWILTVLHKGFNFPLDPKQKDGEHDFLDAFQSTAKINGKEVSWTMGKALMIASSSVESAHGGQVGFMSSEGLILTEEPLVVVQQTSSLWYVLVIALFAAALGLVIKKTRKGYMPLKAVWGEQGLPESEPPRASRPPSRTSTPFELSNLGSSPNLGGRTTPFSPYTPTFGRDGGSTTISRAPSRVSSRLNIMSMDNDD